ncbi:two-component system, chemotaxis family, sensor kinase CheA [Marinitoga hydrogenitolerans DSM 16785]|uniref:histidine kinase n=1 Tax=Marinitoga hydrogenitolerans (strain DSM 16785 / JCM 12826 / AT1271) TaxID=1122195 RepID=A0A1M4UIX2_MARH1|nr:chemotaxis protein CheA [Marinitoga hydrogenitolerans]SHE56649.1 two-component system, chemotaxis family, sensor kinase CheA [Marinitoga hydrogenitolerans DSM 16785]
MKMQFDKDFIKGVLKDFKEELSENINFAENSIIEFENNPAPEIINSLMRAFHSIKGVSRLLLSMDIPEDYVENAQKIEKISHSLEDYVLMFEKNPKGVKNIDKIYEGIDILKSLLKSFENKEKSIDIKPFLKRIKSKNKIYEKEEIDGKLKVFLNISSQLFEYLEKAEKYEESQLKRMSFPAINALKRLGKEDLTQSFQKIIDFALKGDRDSAKKNIDEFYKKLFIKNGIENKPELQYKPEFSNTIRIDVKKLNNIMNLVGELITLKNSSSFLLKELLDVSSSLYKEYKKIFSNLEKITTDLQDQIRKLKMVPIKELLYKYKRLIRELSKNQNKEINYEISGGEIEIDRLVLERLVDPLTHLIRNAVDHGIETIDERVKLGKNKEGLIKINTYYESGYVLIEIIDDGKGIDPEKIRKKAKEKGFNTNLSDDEIIQYIFEPGFSTSETINEISGRGVGMDVVKNNIEELNGSISFETKLNQGTKFILKIPSSLSIIDGIMFYCGKEKYIFPFEEIEQVIKLEKNKLHNYSNTVFAEYNSELIPVYDLKGILENKMYNFEEIIQREYEYDLMPMIIINYNGDNLAILIDKFIEENEFLIKPLPEYLKQNFIFGSTILGNGEVVLILRPIGLIIQ